MATPSVGLCGNQKEQRKLTCRRALATWLTLWGLSLAGAAQCAAQEFTTTHASSINPSGAITGSYLTAGAYHGFLRDADGTITSFDPEGSIDTFAKSINDSGAITGSYLTAGDDHGFLRDPDGTITSFDVPDSIGTIPESINPSGAITGRYFTGVYHGFLRDADGTFSSFDPSGSTDTAASTAARRSPGITSR